MAIFRLNYLNQVQIAANISSRNRTKAIIQRFPKFLPANLAAWESNFKTISALLISKDLDSIEQETILYDREKGIDFPEIE